MKYFSYKIINKNQLINNIKSLKNFTKKDICSVVKADAYGHNIKSICKILRGYCNFFAVQNLYEAIEVRKYNKTAKVLVLGYTINYNLAEKYNISVTIDSYKELLKLINTHKNLPVHLKINTGMNRFGINSIYEFYKVIKAILESNIKLEGIYTHLFDTSNKDVTENQIKIFKKFLSLIPKSLNPIIHIGGSGAINYKLNFVDYYRCGISLYGYGSSVVKPCMKITSKIVKTFDVKKGGNVGYDSFFTAKKDIKVAIVPLGYADGIIRSFQEDMYVYYKNKKLKFIGKICMDMFMIDISDTNIKSGDIVTVFKDAKQWESKSKVSAYEILTGFIKSRTNILIK